MLFNNGLVLKPTMGQGQPFSYMMLNSFPLLPGMNLAQHHLFWGPPSSPRMRNFHAATKQKQYF
jgi:hypothetical protein